MARLKEVVNCSAYPDQAILKEEVRLKDVMNHEDSMKKFMNIYDILRTPDGQAIITGTDPNLDSLSVSEIKRLAGTLVTIVRGAESGSVDCAVLGVETTESLIGKKNVFLKLDISFEDAKNLIGSEVVVA